MAARCAGVKARARAAARRGGSGPPPPSPPSASPAAACEPLPPPPLPWLPLLPLSAARPPAALPPPPPLPASAAAGGARLGGAGAPCAGPLEAGGGQPEEADGERRGSSRKRTVGSCRRGRWTSACGQGGGKEWSRSGGIEARAGKHMRRCAKRSTLLLQCTARMTASWQASPALGTRASRLHCSIGRPTLRTACTSHVGALPYLEFAHVRYKRIQRCHVYRTARQQQLLRLLARSHRR
jgi:hypothetical protein